MKIGIGLPTFFPGVDRKLILEWSRRADEGPFSTLGITDRIAYSSFEIVTTLGAMAAATERVQLFTGILVVPNRPVGLLAKQIATVDALSGGRLSLGIAVGGREDDYLAAGANYRGRGKRMDQHVATMRRIWAGESLSGEVGPIGVPPVQAGGPEVLIAALTPAAAERAGRIADGFVASPSNPVRGAALYEVAEKARQEAGREKPLRFVGGMYYALGESEAEEGSANLQHYYSFMGARDGASVADYIKGTLRATPQAVKDTIQACRDVGMDEIVLWPSLGNINQLERAAELI